MNKPLVSIVIVSYNSARFIEQCLDSIFAQGYPKIEVIIVVTGSADGSKDLILEKYGRRRNLKVVDPGENLWFAKGNNLGFEKATGDYILALNQDTIIEPQALKLLVKVMEQDETLGSVSPKLLHYRYDIDSKTKILDSTGIEMFRSRRVIDRGQWEEDKGQYDQERKIFGASGAAALYRRSALEEVKLPKRNNGFEYYDENFVAYKEDIDLAWRLLLLGYHCRYLPEAVIYHGRTVGRSWPSQVIRFVLNRRHQSRLIRQLAFRNHYLMMLKNELPALFWRHFIYILIRETLLLAYTIIFEPFQVKAIREVFAYWKDTLRKRRLIMRKVRVRPDNIRYLFH